MIQLDRSQTFGAEDHVPGLSRGIIASDLGVQETSPRVRVLGLELVDNNTFLVLLRFFLNLGRSLCRDLCSNRNQLPACGNVPRMQPCLQNPDSEFREMQAQK